MSDPYKAWLQEQVKYWRETCLAEINKYGNPSKEITATSIKWASPEAREILDTYEECLEQYEKLAPSPSLSETE